MPVINGEYKIRSTEEIAEVVAEELRSEFGNDIDLTSSSAFRHIVVAWAQSVHDIQEEQIKEVYRSAYIDTAEGESLEHVVSILGISRQEAIKATGEVTFYRADEAITDYIIPKGTIVQTTGPDPITFETIEKGVLDKGTTQETVTIRAVEGGSQGNVAPNTITVMASPPAGAEFVTNTEAIGDSENTTQAGIPYVTGVDRESDAELRARAKATVTDGAVATLDAIYSALVSEIPEVQSASIFVNNTTTDLRDQGGLPPVSFEAVVYGGDKREIAETIFDEMALTARSYAGAHGTPIDVPITASNGQVYKVFFSRPIEKRVFIELSLVVEEDYIGDAALKNEIIEFIGGTDTRGVRQFGLGVGEDIIVDELTDIIVDVDGPITGVTGIANLRIEDGAGTSLITQNNQGLAAVVIDSDTVAETDADRVTISTEAEITTQSGGQ